jgi:nitroimidazol reductase NimA-like FMN-containing flavoprotein (pyridoxamine 5'-phosphate oxidase superfamily)
MQQNNVMSANRTIPARVPEQVSTTDRPARDRLLADAVIGHFAFVEEGRPVVMPIAFAPEADALILHGSTGSWWLRRLATGIPVTASIMAVDGLVYARSAFESSMRYRSAILFGSCESLDGAEKLAALDLVTNSLLPGRLGELRPHNRKELAATLILRMNIHEWTIKHSTRWPEDPDEDIATDTWAGVLPIVTIYGDAINAPDLRPGIPVAPSVAHLAGQNRIRPT